MLHLNGEQPKNAHTQLNRSSVGTLFIYVRI